MAGSGRFQATRVGADSYARRLATEARRFTLVRSELVDGTNRILQLVQWAIVPTAILLAFSQFKAFHSSRRAVAGVIAGMVAMIPEGLVLLDEPRVRGRGGLARPQACAGAGAAGRRGPGARRRGGARQDGNDHRGRDAIRHARGGRGPRRRLRRVGRARGGRAPQRDDAGAVRGVPDPGRMDPDGIGLVLLGAQVERRVVRAARHVGARRTRDGLGRASRPDDPIRERCERLATDGRRVLLLARSRRAARRRRAARHLEAAAFVLFDEQIRADATETIRYFAEQGVACKVMSGDSPRTVGAVAARVGIVGAEQPVDGRDLPEALEALGEMLETHLGDRPGDAAPEAGDRRRAPASRARRRHDGRRRERRARPEGRRHRYRHG